MTEINNNRCLTCGIKDCDTCDVVKGDTVLTATTPSPSQQSLRGIEYADDVAKIEFTTCEGGEYEVLKFNGEEYDAGHIIPSSTWIDLLRELGFTVEEKEISDEDMEEGNF